jgi:hypothetical protein
VNCAGNHPASYRGCPVYLETKARAEKSAKTKTPNLATPNISAQNFPSLPKTNFVPAPPPKSNAWQKNSTPPPTEKPKEHKTEDFSTRDILNLAKEYFDIKSVIATIMKILQRCRSEAKSLEDILTILLEEITNVLFSSAK